MASLVRRRPAPAPPSVPYQVDLSTSKTGKHLSPTKRRVKFSFGLASLPHLGLGCTGADARGIEHEVLLLWSLASGKRRVLLDGSEVHFSTGPLGQNAFSTSFPLRGAGNHQLQIVADLSKGPNSSAGTFGHSKHFDLLLDGQSFHEMLPIYELGGPRCRSMYPQAYNYAQALPRAELEKAAKSIGTARGQGGGIRRIVPERIVEHYEDATYAAVGEMDSSGASDFDTVTPKDRVEEKVMYEYAKQKSLRSRSSRTRAGNGHQSARGQIPSFGAVHGAFQSSVRVSQQQRPMGAMRTISEGTDLIDLSSRHPSANHGQQGLSKPAGVERTPSDITIDLPDQSAQQQDDVSVMADDASVVSGWGTGPQLPNELFGESSRSFAFAAAPTWEDAIHAFGTGTTYAPQQPAPPMGSAPPPSRPTSYQRSYTGSTVAPSFAAAPPSVAPPSTYAATDASFAQRAAPNMPGSGASFAFAPAPTLEELNAQFVAPAMPPPQQVPSVPPNSSYWQQEQQQQQQQQQKPSYANYYSDSSSTNPFNPSYRGSY